MEALADYIPVVIALPLLGAVANHFFGRFLGEPRAGYLGALAIGGAFGFALLAALPFVAGTGEPHSVLLWEWMPAIGASFEFLWDPLSAVMTLIITGVGTLIHVYSVGYMHGDIRFSRFFTYLNLFAASMLTLVLANNFAVLFLGWELVGLCSYLLISFWYTRPSAAAAGKKAFVVNRIGDFGFLVGLMIVFAAFGTLTFDTVLNDPGATITTGTATAIALLFLVGAAGKSAQIPLYVWLPDAMEGPTPVSALIHAATMVTAGVYLVARAAPIFELSPGALLTVSTVGALTALVAATIAMAQWDIKKVLAYSTVSQLGYMFLAVGAGAYVAGIFHLMTHAFFKALLFLGAGSVIHGMDDEQDMRKMGGLRKAMPRTHATMLIATLAIAGIFPLAGFWSKDEILAVSFDAGGFYVVLWGIGLLTALLTAFYMTRQYLLVFHGEPNWDDGVEPHESPNSMTVPLMILAVLSVVGGFVNTPFRLTLEHFLEPSFEFLGKISHPDDLLLLVLALASLGVAVAGMTAAWFVYGPRSRTAGERFLGSFRRPLFAMENAYWVDDVYGRLIVLPGKKVAEWSAFVFDSRVIDGLVNGVAVAVQRVGALLRPVQTGFVRNYGALLAAGTLAVVIWMVAS